MVQNSSCLCTLPTVTCDPCAPTPLHPQPEPNPNPTPNPTTHHAGGAFGRWLATVGWLGVLTPVPHPPPTPDPSPTHPAGGAFGRWLATLSWLALAAGGRGGGSQAPQLLVFLEWLTQLVQVTGVLSCSHRSGGIWKHPAVSSRAGPVCCCACRTAQSWWQL